ncbi:MAG: GNAT family N-acetyltransferase [Anaerolineae bacterium]|jgi:ribosomal protein S18 acetylase RimI-like enzyme|nr:GNAT family N-acetyltransferase [Anaerolineae bacterium]
MISLRPARLPDEIEPLAAIDTSFITPYIYRVQHDDLTFRLIPEPVDPPRRKAFSIQDEPPDMVWDHTTVAVDGDRIVGMIAIVLSHWNRRAIVWHLYVDPAYRGQGIGRRLLEAATDYGRSQSMRCLALETSNLDYPAIQFYLRVGFTLSGFDETYYDLVDEFAIFLSRPL